MEALRELITMSDYEPNSGDMKHLFELAFQTSLSREEIKEKFTSDASFRNTYKKLKDKYLEEVLLNDFADSSEYNQRLCAIWKKYAQVKLLWKAGKKKAAVSISVEVKSSAKKFGIAEIVLDMSRELMNYYSVVELNRRKFREYQVKSKHYAQAVCNEVRAQEVFNLLALEVRLGVAPSSIREDLKELDKIAETNEEYRFRLYYYSAKNLYRRLKKDREGIVNTCEDALDFFEASKFRMSPLVKWNFHLHLIPILISQSRYDKARQRLRMCLSLTYKGSYNYHSTLLLKAVCGIHSGRIGDAVDALNQAGEEWFFKSESVVERWLMIQDAIKRVEGGESFEVVGTVLLGRIYSV